MPGLSFLCSADGVSNQKSFYLRSAQSPDHPDGYKREVFFENEKFFLGGSSYDGYPINYFENDDHYIFVEGKIYFDGRESLESRLVSFAEELFSGGDDQKNLIKSRLLHFDGAFIIFFFDKRTRRIVIVNDLLSRLPFYLYCSENSICISRDYSFINANIDEKVFDAVFVSDYLLFGYFLGTGTFLKDVERVPPSCVITIDVDNCSVSKEVVHEFNFEDKKHKYKSANQNAKDLAELFIGACRKQVSVSGKTIVSLSGGMDSRAICAGLLKGGQEFFARTWIDFDKNAKCDAETAEQLTKVLNIKWKVEELPRALGRKNLDILTLKNGFADFTNVHALSYFTSVRNEFGTDIVMLSGNGGDKVMPDLRPYKKVKSIDDLVDFIIAKNCAFSLRAVAALTGGSEEKIKRRLRDHILSYPEKSLRQKYVHFLIYERLFGRFLEGEDRKRAFFWSSSPFLSIPFFCYAMNCPDSQKTNRYLYAKFLSMLSPDALNVGYAIQYGTNVDSTIRISIAKDKSLFWQVIRRINKLPNPVRFIYKKMKGPQAEEKPKVRHSVFRVLSNCLKEQIDGCPSLTQVFSDGALNDVLAKLDEYDTRSLDRLFVVISAIEYLSNGQSTIEKYSGEDFNYFE